MVYVCGQRICWLHVCLFVLLVYWWWTLITGGSQRRRWDVCCVHCVAFDRNIMCTLLSSRFTADWPFCWEQRLLIEAFDVVHLLADIIGLMVRNLESGIWGPELGNITPDSSNSHCCVQTRLRSQCITLTRPFTVHVTVKYYRLWTNLVWWLCTLYADYDSISVDAVSRYVAQYCLLSKMSHQKYQYFVLCSLFSSCRCLLSGNNFECVFCTLSLAKRFNSLLCSQNFGKIWLHL